MSSGLEKSIKKGGELRSPLKESGKSDPWVQRRSSGGLHHGSFTEHKVDLTMDISLHVATTIQRLEKKQTTRQYDKHQTSLLKKEEK